MQYRPTQGPDLGREKVCRDQHVQMRPGKLLPGGRGLARWSRHHAMAFQHVPHGLVTDHVSEVRKGADDPVITSGAILPCQTHHQRFQSMVVPLRLGRSRFIGNLTKRVPRSWYRAE